jgi:hypothetical protein
MVLLEWLLLHKALALMFDCIADTLIAVSVGIIVSTVKQKTHVSILPLNQ